MQLRAPAARQQRHHAAPGRKAQLNACLRFVRIHRNHVGQRVADIGHGQPLFLVEGRLERENGEQVRHGAHDAPCAPAAPGPDRRTDVLDRGNAGVLQLAFEVEIEIGRIDADEHCRPLLQHALGYLAPDRHDSPVVTQHLRIAAHAEPVHRHVRFESLRDHLRAADAGKTQLRSARLERRDQVGSQQVARSLGGDHADVDAGIRVHELRVH